MGRKQKTRRLNPKGETTTKKERAARMRRRERETAPCVGKRERREKKCAKHGSNTHAHNYEHRK